MNILNEILKKMDPYLECGRTALQEAIYTSNYEEAKRLIYNGANTRQLTKLGATSLHLACQNLLYNETLVEMLTSVRDPNALDAACSAGHLPIVRILRKYGIPLRERNSCGGNGFCYAVENGHVQVVYFLLHHYYIFEDMKTQLPFMKLVRSSPQKLSGARYGFVCNTFPLYTRMEWCKMVDVYFAVVESMINLPRNLELYNGLWPYIEYFRQIRERVRTWLRCSIQRDVRRIIGWHLWNTRFECIPYDGLTIPIN